MTDSRRGSLDSRGSVLWCNADSNIDLHILKNKIIKHRMSYKFLAVDKHSPGIYIITLKKPPENRLTVEFCQELIQAYHKMVSDLQQIMHNIFMADSATAIRCGF
jgi:hypothetical protein